MAKPINENIRDVRIENEDGDLIPVLDHAGEEFGVTPIPLQTAALAHAVYIEGLDFDVRDYQK